MSSDRWAANAFRVIVLAGLLLRTPSLGTRYVFGMKVRAGLVMKRETAAVSAMETSLDENAS